MGLFGNKEKIPELPPAPSLPELPKPSGEKLAEKNLPELPSFPESKSNESLNQEMVKSAVNDSPEVNEVTVDAPEELHVTEEQGGSQIPPKPSEPIPEPPKPQPKKTMELNEFKKTDSSNEPIFVRIDKFQESQKNFDDIRDKVKEIESVLRKIKDLKTKETEEIESWSKEIENVKMKLYSIDEDIFNQI